MDGTERGGSEHRHFPERDQRRRDPLRRRTGHASDAERDAFLARSKIMLNVHYYESRLFEIVRVSYLLANRKCVVSETGADRAIEQQFEPGIAFAPYEKLAETCIGLLKDAAARGATAEAGLARIKSMPQTEYLRQALSTLQA